MDQTAIDNKPNAEVLKMVQGLCADPNNFVFIISGRARTELSHWFDPCVSLQRSPQAARMLACQNLECVGVNPLACTARSLLTRQDQTVLLCC